MIAFGLIVRSTVSRLLRRRRVIGMTFLTGATAPMLFSVAFGRSDEEILEIYQFLTIVLGMALAFPIASIIVGTAAFGEERKAHTLPFLLLKPVSRLLIAAGVTVGAAVSSFVVMFTGVALTWLAAVSFTGAWNIGWPTTIAIMIQAIASAALFVPLGLLFSRATLVGLAYLFIWEIILTSVVTGFIASSIYRITVSGYADLAELSPEVFSEVDEILNTVAIGAGGAFAKVLVMAAISIALTTIILRSRDLAEE